MNISIITVHLNDFSGLRETGRSLQSLRSQTEVQWIVIDGASTLANDTQREVFASAQQTSSNFVSEPDSGIYAAMNKGIDLANEPYVLFLNAGDRLHPAFDPAHVFKEVGHNFPDMIWGSYDESGKRNRLSNIQPRNKKWLWWGMPTSHQAMFFRREFLDQNRYDENLNIAGDYDMVLKLVNKGATIETTSVPVCISDGMGISNLEQRAALNEQMLVRARYFGTSTILNRLLSVAHLTINRLGCVRILRKLWK